MKQTKQAQKISENNPHGKIIAAWAFPEFVKYQRTAVWYTITVIAGALCFFYGIFTRNFLFSLIVVMVALIFFLYHIKHPLNIKFAITEDGIGLGNAFYLWKDLQSFWIIYEPPEVKQLYLQTKRFFPGALSVPLEKENPVKVRAALLKYLPEDSTKTTELASDTFSRILKI
jgi:hypothetical protein